MELDMNTLRSAITVISFAAFIAILYWVLSKRRSADFSEAANLPFEQD